eukprot:Polyplicarium_translucidae@DN540_c0_g1_i1.p1
MRRLRWMGGVAVVSLVAVLVERTGHGIIPRRLSETLALGVGSVVGPLVKRYGTLGRRFWDTDVEVEGIEKELKILRDDHGIPHVFADSRADALFAQRFVQATERPWQLESFRLFCQGRLASVLGSKAVGVDKLMRSLGISEAAKDDVLAAEKEPLVASYVRGITSGLQHLPRQPFEARVLRHRINSTWTEFDSYSIIRCLAVVMTRSWTVELSDVLLVKELGHRADLFNMEATSRETTSKINPRHGSGNCSFPAVPDFDDDSWSFPPSAKKLEELERSLKKSLLSPPSSSGDPPTGAAGGDGVPIVGGSNGWAVAGRHSKSGGALIAGDPHLQM